MSRHRKIPGHRSRAVALIAAGAFTVATAATAAAATWPAGPAAGRAHDPAQGAAHDAAGSLLTATGQPLRVSAFGPSTASQSLPDDPIRDAAAGLAATHRMAAREQAAKQAAAAPARTAASQPAAQSTAQLAGAQAATAASAGSPQQIAEAMLGSFGWSSSQFSCLDPLWAHESGWSATAANPDGAYGIPQALPGAKMASAGPDWQTNAATQIRWGLEYIQSTYGSPCAAWGHEQATGWY